VQIWAYPVTVIEHAGPHAIGVRFPDIPEISVEGANTQEEALAVAAEILNETIRGYLAQSLPVPNPRPARMGEHTVALNPATAARVILTRAMAEQNLSNVALAAKMNQDEKVVRRILLGNTSFEKTLAALHALGIWPTLAV
jgi:hypothetical protein